MTEDYKYELQKAEGILSDAQFTHEAGDITLYYDLYDELGQLNLTDEDKDLFRTRLDSMLGLFLK